MSNTSPFTNGTLPMATMPTCLHVGLRVISRGIFLGEDPLNFSFPLLIVQLSLVNFFSGAFRLLLKPFRQPNFVADLLGGIALGPSLLGHNQIFHKSIFSPETPMMLDVYEILSIILFTFLVGMRTDVTVIKKTGSLSLIIGLTSFFLPMILTKILSAFLTSNLYLDNSFEHSLGVLSFLQSMMNFHIIYSILTELKLLNSELGRLALSSSMISTLCSWSYAVLMKTLNDGRGGVTKAVLAAMMCRLFMIFFIMCVCRPIMFWMIRKTPEGKTLKEDYVCTLTLMILGTALYCEVMGIEPIAGAIFLGMSVPGGPPLGSGLVDKLELFVSAVLLPSFIVNVGRKVNVYKVTLNSFVKVEGFVLCGFLGKVAGTMVPSIYKNIPVVDAFLIGLLLSCQGFIDISFFSHALRVKFITEESFTIMVMMAILQAAIITPFVRYLYDPSRKYTAYKRRTIEHSRRNAELRILACICQEDNVPTLINILEASNPTRASPIGVYVLELVELVGQAMPLLINHRTDRKTSRYNTRSDRIVKAFNQYALQNEGTVSVQCFTSIAPFATIHDDICSLALDKITSLVIIPFQNSDGPALRSMQKKVLQKASCSVAILIDREHGILKSSRTVSKPWFTLHVCVVFLGGPDDREALAYGTRMADHLNIMVTVIRIYNMRQDDIDLIEAQHDLNAVNDFRLTQVDNNRVVYKEVGVSEGPETAEVLHSLSEGFDLMLVGRRREQGSSLVMGLSEWCEIKELGVIGDFLTSSDYKSKASVLVVQQQDSSIVDDVTKSSVHLNGQYA